jgi:ribosomal protein S18 acetylase RimI-like enzyme
MQIRPAELPDLNACYLLNGNYATDYVWQMQNRNQGHRIDIRFDRVRLPRKMQVEYPRSPNELLEHWQQEGCFLVIRNRQEQVVGYLDALPQAWQHLVWIHNLVIAPEYRRQGAAGKLLAAAKQWAGQQLLNTIMLEIQTKNYPAIAFAQKHGFKFCGFNERYYTNGDIALHFYHSF